LISRNRHEEALQVLQITQGRHKNEKPEDSQIVAIQYREIADTIAWEKEQGLSLMQAVSRKSSRRRLTIAATFSLFVMLPGTNLITFYFGDLLASAGIMLKMWNQDCCLIFLRTERWQLYKGPLKQTDAPRTIHSLTVTQVSGFIHNR
jgi:hypothetical protein